MEYGWSKHSLLDARDLSNQPTKAHRENNVALAVEKNLKLRRNKLCEMQALWL